MNQKLIVVIIILIIANLSLYVLKGGTDPLFIGVVFPAVSSGIVAYGIALYVKYKMKPKYEEVFEANRKTSLKFLFNPLDDYHNRATFIFDEFESRFGNLSRTRRELVRQLRFVPIDQINESETVDFADIMRGDDALTELNNRLKPTFDQMKKHQQNFERDFMLYEPYFHITFLQDIRQLYWQTNYYIECLFEGDLVPSCLDSSRNCAEKIIKYLKDDETLNKSEQSVKKFIDIWEREINQH